MYQKHLEEKKKLEEEQKKQEKHEAEEKKKQEENTSEGAKTEMEMLKNQGTWLESLVLLYCNVPNIIKLYQYEIFI